MNFNDVAATAAAAANPAGLAAPPVPETENIHGEGPSPANPEIALPPPAVLPPQQLADHDLAVQPPAGANPPAQNGNLEANKQLDGRAVARKHFLSIASAGIVCILLTGGAMKAAGCTYDDIKWPVTIEVTLVTALLSPLIPKCIIAA
ncbi:hypothetical protein JX265_003035 [Neoarthrinium moseri]|uniref:Uncharacterized protein n=1 Tax=Neoarthrinium moseri TaxID=1658444 RepID=A0A9Q0APV5_9PEZI|nr:uncharacterized protein JN550_006036 [Neoarthrinium moseri]KAI1841987.1 hypothetical protein JX266_011847 [Neoarthrinium moseri]KAI1869049.1 hypothetical protein JN550_006036 [Neoarthrinium moseri]KAI1878858.1 hypothetical protein JX265_003035 [Neoarthrinium moseri]